MALNRARVAKDIDITNDMSYQVVVEYFDSANPGAVLWSETFTIPSNATVAQLEAQVVTRGQQVRVGLANLAAAKLAVPNGTVTTVP